MTKFIKLAVFLIALIVLIPAGKGYGYWVWSPETNEWINPVYRTFDTPKEQFDWAMGFFKDAEYRKAIVEFRKVLSKFPKTSHAAEAKFHVAVCYEALGKLNHAFKVFQEVLDTYPLNERLEEIAEKQYLIGEKFFNRRKYERAKDIFQKVISNTPYGKVSDVVQYNIGLCYLRMHQYMEARDEFEYLIENYSFSPYVDDATFQIGFCSFKISSSVKYYDIELINKAMEDLDYFLRRFKTSEYVIQAESLLSKLKNKKAERFFSIAYFYEKQKKLVSATKYYEELIYDYDKTSWAKKARPRLERLR